MPPETPKTVDPKTAAKHEAERLVRTLYDQGYAAGFKKTQDQFSDRTDSTMLVPATDEEKAKWSWYGLEYFCSKCEKGLGPNASGFLFCPHCGRTITRTDAPVSAN